MNPMRSVRRGIAALVLMLAAVVPASAHRESAATPASPDGLSIPSLSHGQMAVIADNLPAIRALAESQFPTDPVMRRLQAFVNLQSFACAWGLVPGAVRDEESPFNECAHAYLAGARSLLVHLREMPGGDRAAVGSLTAKVEREMLDNNASLVLCRHSDEPFNTSELIFPRWSEIPGHPPSLATFGGIALCLAMAAWSGLAAARTKARNP